MKHLYRLKKNHYHDIPYSSNTYKKDKFGHYNCLNNKIPIKEGDLFIIIDDFRKDYGPYRTRKASYTIHLKTGKITSVYNEFLREL